MECRFLSCYYRSGLRYSFLLVKIKMQILYLISNSWSPPLFLDFCIITNMNKPVPVTKDDELLMRKLEEKLAHKDISRDEVPVLLALYSV